MAASRTVLMSLVLFCLFSCAKQGSVVAPVPVNNAVGANTSIGTSACSAASSSAATYYSSLSQCTATWGDGNCSLIVVGFNDSNYACYVKTALITAGGSSTPTPTLTPNGSVSPTPTPAGSPTLTLSPSSASLGTVILGNLSVPRVFTVSNSGTGPATGCGVSLTNPSNFFKSQTCSSILSAGASCTITVTGVPSVLSTVSATLTLACLNSANRTATLTMTGTSGSTSGGSGGGSGSGSGSSGCFIAGTLVDMADGSQKRIEEVRAGERVRGASGRINVVERTFRIPHQGLKFGFNGGKKFFTDSHPFLTKQGWKSFNPRVSSRENPGVAFLTLAPGDRIQTREGELEIHSLDSVRDSRWVYNLKTDGDHSFIADGYKVHNAAIKDTGSTGLSTPK